MAEIKNKISSSTQQHLDVDDITDNLVILKNGRVAMILSTTAVNFDILSEAEQDATIYAYAALLNSLSFPLEVIIRSKKADITAYYQHLEQSMREQPNPDLKKQIQKYMDFIQSVVQQKTILDKQFYLIINFSTLELGLKGMKKQPTQPKNKTELLKEAEIHLLPKRDHIIKQTARLGLATKQLTTRELIELFYDIYNPAPTGTQSINIDSAGYSQPLVKPAVESPEPSPEPYGSKLTDPETSLNPRGEVNLGINPVPTHTEQQSAQIPSQREALKSLQQATNKAAQFIDQQKSIYQQSQSQIISDNPIPSNIAHQGNMQRFGNQNLSNPSKNQ